MSRLRGNWPGVLAVALAALGVVSYPGVVVWSNYLSLNPEASTGKLTGPAFLVSLIAAAASTLSESPPYSARGVVTGDSQRRSPALQLEPC